MTGQLAFRINASPVLSRSTRATVPHRPEPIRSRSISPHSSIRLSAGGPKVTSSSKSAPVAQAATLGAFAQRLELGSKNLIPHLADHCAVLARRADGGKPVVQHRADAQRRPGRQGQLSGAAKGHPCFRAIVVADADALERPRCARGEASGRDGQGTWRIVEQLPGCVVDAQPSVGGFRARADDEQIPMLARTTRSSARGTEESVFTAMSASGATASRSCRTTSSARSCMAVHPNPGAVGSSGLR